jgi:hypothetical protein
MIQTATWPFRSKIPRLKGISKDIFGDIDLVLSNTSYRFNEKDIISTALKSDYFSKLYLSKNSKIPGIIKWIWNHKWQLFLTLVFISGLCNWMNYSELYQKEPYKSTYISEFEVLKTISLRSLVKSLLFFGLPIFLFLGYLRKLLERYFISKYSNFFMVKDIVEVRLNGITIQFRCINDKEFQNVYNCIEITSKNQVTNLSEKQELVRFKPFNYGDLVHVLFLTFFLLIFYIYRELPTWWYSLFNDANAKHGGIFPEWLQSYGKNYGFGSNQYLWYFHGAEKGNLELFSDGAISGIGLIFCLLCIILCFILVLIVGVFGFLWPLFLLFLYKDKLPKKVFYTLLVLSFLYVVFIFFELDGSYLKFTEEFKKNFALFNLLITPVFFIILFFIGLIILIYQKLTGNTKEKTTETDNSIYMASKDLSTFIFHEGKTYELQDLKARKVPLIDSEIPYFKINHLFKYEHIDFEVIHSLRKKAL